MERSREKIKEKENRGRVYEEGSQEFLKKKKFGGGANFLEYIIHKISLSISVR